MVTFMGRHAMIFNDTFENVQGHRPPKQILHRKQSMIYQGAGKPDAEAPISVNCVRGSSKPLYCGWKVALV